jgi:transforming growth factor-beta-induced protein
MRHLITSLAALFVAAIIVIPVGAQERNLAEAAQAATGFNTLLAAAEAAGLAEELATGGPYTVFAPTDGAFAAALANLGLTAEDLLADTDTLTAILSFHIVRGEFTASDLITLIENSGGTAQLRTLNGATLTAELVTLDVTPAAEEGAVETPEPVFQDFIYLNRANQDISVFLPNVSASNGVLHGISGVLLPPADSAEAAPGTIVEVAAGNESFTTLVAAVEAAGLIPTLSEGTFTVFAPTNEAFAAALDSLGLTVNELVADTDTLTTILTYHVIEGDFSAEDITMLIDEVAEGLEFEGFTMVSGETLPAEIVDGSVVLGGGAATVVTPDVEASNGTIHVIDGVLLPPSITGEGGEEAAAAEPAEEEAAAEPAEAAAEPGTIVEVAASTEGFSTLVAAVEAAGLVDTLNEGTFTVFAPTDDAFAAALEALGVSAEDLLADTETLTSILTFHVVPGTFSSGGLIALSSNGVADLTTVNGADLPFAIDGDALVLNDSATVITADVEASNGVIHVIDTVLLPPSE